MISITTAKPPVCVPVIGFHESWKHEDYNPKGMHECFMMDDESWMVSIWNNDQDCWDTLEYPSPFGPSHWQYFPEPPVL